MIFCMERSAASYDGEEKNGIDPLTSFLDEIATLAVMFRDGHVIFANRNFIQYLGKDDIVGMDEKSVLSAIAPGDAELPELLERIQKTGQARPRLVKILDKDGKRHEHIVFPRYFLIAPGEYATVFVFIDPEKFWDLETSLAGRPQRFMAILDSLREWVWEIDSECNFIYSNKASESFLGISPADLIGKNINDVLSGPDTEKLIRELVRSFPSDKEYITSHMKYRGKDRKPRYLQIDVFPVFSDDGIFAGFRGVSRDITKEYLSEQRLKISYKKYKTLFEGANDAIFLMSNHVFRDCNGKTLEMFGCAREDIIGRYPWDFSPERQPDGRDSKEKAIEMMENALKEPQRFYWKHRKKDGALFDVEVSLNKLDMGSKDKLLQAIVRDVSEKLAYEERLKETMLKFKTLFEQDPDIRVATDPSMRILDINEAALKLANLKREDAIGKKLDEILPEHIARDSREMLNQVIMAKECIQREYHLRFGDQDRWQEIAISPIIGADGNVNYIMGSVRDITARKLAELALKEQKDKLQLIQDNIDFGVLVIDRNYNIVEMNKQIMRWSPDVKLGQHCKVAFEHCKFATKEAHACPGEMVFETKEPLHMPLEIICDGRTRFLEFRCIPIFDANNEVQYVMEIIDDVTEKNLINWQLNQMRKRAELYVDLMGHDIVNCLTPVNCYIDMLLNNLTLGDEHRELMRLIFEQLSKISALIRNVRTLSETEKLLDYLELQNLKEVIDSAERDAMTLFPWRSIKMRHSFPREKCVVKAHRFLANGLANVYHNAIKADTHDEVEIDTEISKTKTESGEYYLIRINDRGHGIPDELKEKLFSKELTNLESMYEHPSTRTSRGFGLHIVKMIVNLSGGSIQIEDRVPGDFAQGASFLIRLPVKS